MANAGDVMRVRLSAEGIQEVMDALKKVGDQAKRTKKDSEGAGSTLRDELRDLGIMAALQQLAMFTKSNIDAQAAIQDMSEVTGASAEAISTLGIAAEKEGVSMESLGKNIKGFTKFLGNLQTGSAEAAQTLSTLGLTSKDVLGKSLDQQLVILADRFSTFSDDGQSGLNKTAIALKMFGKSGEDMRQVMQRLTGDGFQKLQEEGRKTGQVLDTDTAQNAKKAKEEMETLKGRVAGVTNAFSQGLMPALGDVGKALGGISGNDTLTGFKKIGEAVGWLSKGVVSSFLVVGKTLGNGLAAWGEFLDAIVDILKTGGDLISQGFTAITTATAQGIKGNLSGARKTLSVEFDKIGNDSMRLSERTLGHIKSMADVTVGSGLDSTLDSVDSIWNPRTDGAVPVSGGEKGKSPRKKNLNIPDASASKSASAALAAGAKRDLEATKSQIESVSSEWEHAYKTGLVSLSDYLESRKELIQIGTDAEVEALRKQIEAEEKAPTTNAGEVTTKANKIADLNAQITTKQEEGERKLQALEYEGDEKRRTAAEESLKLEADLEAAKGKTGKAAIAAINAEYDERIRKANEAPDKARLQSLKQYAIVRKGLEGAQHQGDVAQKNLDNALTGIDQQESSHQISGTEAVQQRIQAYQDWIDIMEEAADSQKKLAAQTGDRGQMADADSQVIKINGLKQSLLELQDPLHALKEAGRDAFENGLSEFLDTLGDQTMSLSEKFQALGRSIASAMLQQASARMAAMAADTVLGSFGGSTPTTKTTMDLTFAGGGEVSGPGTATSDSILARVSNGEFINRTASVAYYGREFFHALNGLRVPKSMLPGFADGGLVGRASGAPAIAEAMQPRVKVIVVHSVEEAALEALRSRRGEQVVMQHVNRNQGGF